MFTAWCLRRAQGKGNAPGTLGVMDAFLCLSDGMGVVAESGVVGPTRLCASGKLAVCGDGEGVMRVPGDIGRSGEDGVRGGLARVVEFIVSRDGRAQVRSCAPPRAAASFLPSSNPS